MALTNEEASIVLGMVARGDKEHHIAAWFGENQGRIAEVKDGSHGSISAAPSEKLPPKGPPGIKGRRLRAFVAKALAALDEGNVELAKQHIRDGLERFDRFEE